jgi:predicted kinase
MEAILFCGIQASGKTSFYAEQFLKTHLRISLDLLHTRNKENIFLQSCIRTGQAFVIDNTNPTKKDRQRYIDSIKPFKFRITGYYFHTTVASAIERNVLRHSKEFIPIAGIMGTYKKLEPLHFEEGFDKLFWVELREKKFIINDGAYLNES